VGAVTPDREKFKGTWRYIVNKDVTAHTGFLYFHDDLEGQLTTPRSDNYKPDAGVTLKKLFGRQYSSLDVTYKLDLQEHRGTPVNEQHFIDTNYRDRFGFLDTDTNLGWTSEKITGGGPSRQQDLTYNTTLSSRHTVDKFILKPSVYLGGWTTRDELAYVTTQIYEYSAGLGVDVPACKITSDFKVGENQLKKTAGGNTAKFFGSGNIYYRPTALAKLQGMLYVKLYVNNFSYTDASRNYRETSVSTGLNMQF
jgi:hypothetical protein